MAPPMHQTGGSQAAPIAACPAALAVLAAMPRRRPWPAHSRRRSGVAIVSGSSLSYSFLTTATLAGLPLQPLSIDGNDAAAAVADQTEPFQAQCALRYASAAYTEHVGDLFLRRDDFVALNAVQAHESCLIRAASDPAATRRVQVADSTFAAPRPAVRRSDGLFVARTTCTSHNSPARRTRSADFVGVVLSPASLIFRKQ